MFSARASRLVGAQSTVAWMMLIGLLVLAPVVVAGGGNGVDIHSAGWLALGGAGNVGGLLLSQRAVTHGRVGVIAPIVAAEGGVAALIAIAAGASVEALRGAALVLVLCGVALTGRTNLTEPHSRLAERRAVALACAAALAFGAGLYATAQAGSLVPLAWAALPPRLVGAALVAAPLAARARLAIEPRVLPWIAVAAVCEVLGFLSYGFGARDSLVTTAVLASLTGAVAAALGRFFLAERLAAHQLAGIAVIVGGVALLGALGG